MLFLLLLRACVQMYGRDQLLKVYSAKEVRFGIRLIRIELLDAPIGRRSRRRAS